MAHGTQQGQLIGWTSQQLWQQTKAPCSCWSGNYKVQNIAGLISLSDCERAASNMFPGSGAILPASWLNAAICINCTCTVFFCITDPLIPLLLCPIGAVFGAVFAEPW